MRKFLIILVAVTMASFLFVGCLFTPPNQTPIITSDPITTAIVGVTYTYDVNATDPDEDVLTYSLTVMPSGMSINSATGLIIWTPPAKGDYDVTVKVSDGDLDITQPFIITVSETEPEPEPELVLVGITVDPKTMDLIVGGTDTIDSVTACYEIRGYGVDIALGDCLFLTSNKDVAKVEKDGEEVTVTAVAEGTANIVVSYKGKFDTLKVTVKYLPVEITIADMPVFEVGESEGFIVEVVANSDAGKLVKFYFKLPEEATVSIYEGGQWVDLEIFINLDTDEVELGSEKGDLLIDEFRIFRATFSEAGTYSTTLEVRTYPGDVLLCSKVITANVFPEIPDL